MQVIGLRHDSANDHQGKTRQALEALGLSALLHARSDRRWSLLIVRDLLFGCTRYGELLKSGEGIPTNILSQRLKHLERVGIIERLSSSKPRSRYEYRLTKPGLRLAPAIRALAEWGHSEVEGTRSPPPTARRPKHT
jgi:DNA-binding HxlR family transcriptional regulator